MITKDFEMGGFLVNCDGCSYDEFYSGDLWPTTEMKKCGWAIKQENYEWKHFCLSCKKKR